MSMDYGVRRHLFANAGIETLDVQGGDSIKAFCSEGRAYMVIQEPAVVLERPRPDPRSHSIL